MSELSEIEKLKRTMARLREPGGCPWDQEQTHATLAHCLIDETSELLETIDRGDMNHMREELGDVLIQVVFHSRLAEERGLFDLEDVARDINEKLIRRHPHVFGSDNGGVDTPDKVITQWDQIKLQEKAAKGADATKEKLFKDLPPRLPALMFAEAVWKQIEKKKLPRKDIVDDARVNEIAAQLDEAALGKMLFEIAAAARQRGLDPEGALRLHATKVMDAVEEKLANSGITKNTGA
ncbi:MazG family protein [Ereboglobus luteus]|uniref:Nucleotide pyrophosphohydrolase n=1 Tax=Ereboglobus luteus TaxID=1796921 RepID=A0A2U8E6X2_9BACT|nr:MazG family protein [Ereboglobus luteus]AWI10688.1 nucleotide pyrophosphohydrolase [Ereboglobus luteus]